MTLSTMVGPVVPVGDVQRIMLMPAMMGGGVIDLSTIANVAEWRRKAKADPSRFVFEGTDMSLTEKTTKIKGGKWKTDKPAAVGVWKMAAGNPVMFRDDKERPVGWPTDWSWDPKKSKGGKGGIGSDEAGKNPGDEGFDWSNKKMKALLSKAEDVLEKAKEKKNKAAIAKIEALIASIKGEDADGFKGAASDLG